MLAAIHQGVLLPDEALMQYASFLSVLIGECEDFLAVFLLATIPP